MSTFFKHVAAAAFLGCLVGLVLFGLLDVFHDAFQTLDDLASSREPTLRSSYRGPVTLLLLAGGIGGRLGLWWFNRSSGMAGMSVVAPLAIVAAAAAFATGYLLVADEAPLTPATTIARLALAAATLAITACVTQWRNE